MRTCMYVYISAPIYSQPPEPRVLPRYYTAVVRGEGVKAACKVIAAEVDLGYRSLCVTLFRVHSAVVSACCVAGKRKR